MHYSRKTFSKIFVGIIFIFSISGCASIVEPIKLPDLSPDPKLQEKFSIDLVPLTFATATKLNSARYPRLLSMPANAFSANLVSEDTIRKNQFPTEHDSSPYRLGVGDEITLIQYIDKPISLSPDVSDQSSTSIISTTGRIANDGSLLLIGVGRLEAEGRYLTDLQNAVRSILIRNGSVPNFQLEIAAFNSQKALITTDGTDSKSSLVVPITDQVPSLREILAEANIAFNERVLTIVKLQRGDSTFSFSLAELFAEGSRDVYLKDKDHVFIQHLEYVKGKVFLVGGQQPQIIEIQPEFRQTLAEVLFSKNGPLGAPTAQRSAVYLLRGYNPIKAYHLDAQNPARIFVADALEMRPNDIVFVAEQPISTFNRALQTILPLRVFSRDARDGNFP